MTPIFAIIIYLSIYRGILEYNSLDRRFRFLFVFGPLPLIVFLFLSIKQRVNANWPALFLSSCNYIFNCMEFGEI